MGIKFIPVIPWVTVVDIFFLSGNACDPDPTSLTLLDTTRPSGLLFRGFFPASATTTKFQVPLFQLSRSASMIAFLLDEYY